MVERLRPLAADEPQLDLQARRLTLPVSGGAEVLAEALGLLEGSMAVIVDVGLRRPDLDDVFLTLTGHATENGSAGDRAPGAPAAAAGSAR
jgi:ABC-2 type transport system ATP-binding protein